MIKKQVILFFITILLTLNAGCNVNQALEGREKVPFTEFGMESEGLFEQTSDDYRRNEEEALQRGGHQTGELTENTTISNANTDIPSDQYPHTKAIQIQQAKYKFVVDGTTSANIKQHVQNKIGQFRQGHQGAIPAREQGAAPTPAPESNVTPAPQQEVIPAPQAPVAQPEVATPAPAPQQQTESQQTPTANVQGLSNIVQQVINLTNAERQKAGLPAYQGDAQLSNVAKVKSDDMQKNNYFSHTSPTHGSPFDMIRDHGVSYKSAGENIARGQRTAEAVVQSWMNSEGHRKNILSADFTHIGVGYNEQGHYWTQMFIRK